jgi:hypothetical protein
MVREVFHALGKYEADRQELNSERRRERKFGGASFRRALGIWSSPGAVNESRE